MKRRGLIHITFNNERLTLAEWAEKTGLSPSAIYSRAFVYKWPMKRVMTTPVKWKGNAVRIDGTKNTVETLMHLCIAGIRAKNIANVRRVVKQIKEHSKRSNHLKVA